ncbi:MAG: redoxin family protein [Planctomycetota bacterium]
MAVVLRVLAVVLLVCGALLPAQEAPPAVPIGSLVDDLSFLDIRTQRRRLSDLGPCEAVVLFFVSKDCPMVGRVMPKVGRLCSEYAERKVQFVAVDVGRSDTVRDMGTQAILFDQPYPFVRDEGFRVARALGVDRTTAVVVLDRERRIRYRGRVDDQVLYANVKEAPARQDLRAALDAVLGGTDVAVTETPIEGCLISFGPAAEPSGKRTWHRDVEPIVQRRCQDCHHEGGIAPFPLLDYDDAADHAAMIGEVVRRQRMPPWHASDDFGEFRNHLALTAGEREIVEDWVRSGAPRGDAADAPPARSFPEERWRIGEPDLELKATTPTRLPADGIVPYSYVILPYVFREDTWVEAVEILPENGRVLHHANVAWFDPKTGFSQDGFITGFVPGGDPMMLDPGTAMKIPAGSRLGLQAHYVTTGKPEVDRIHVGLRFPRTKVTRAAEVLVVTNTRFVIPPGAFAFPVGARRRVKVDSTIIGLFAHMHLRGRDMTFVAHPPAAEPTTLLMIPDYDFDWQQSYRFHEGKVKLAAGTVVEVKAHFDNSTLNPFNPDPTAEVRFGEQTFDEMMYGFVFLTRDGETLALDIDPKNGRVLAGDRTPR